MLPYQDALPDNSVSVKVDTLYPFSDALTTTITAAQSFTYRVRIPDWVKGGTIAVNGGQPVAVSPSNGLQTIQVNSGTTTIRLNLPAPITTGALHSGLLGSLQLTTCVRHRVPA